MENLLKHLEKVEYQQVAFELKSMPNPGVIILLQTTPPPSAN